LVNNYVLSLTKIWAQDIWPAAGCRRVAARTRRHRSSCPTLVEDSRVDSPAKQLLKLALSQDIAWQDFAIACSNL